MTRSSQRLASQAPCWITFCRAGPLCAALGSWQQVCRWAAGRPVTAPTQMQGAAMLLGCYGVDTATVQITGRSCRLNWCELPELAHDFHKKP